MARRPHLLPRYKVRSSPLHSSCFTTSDFTSSKFASLFQAVVAKALHVTSVEHVFRHIPCSTFRKISVALSMLSSLSQPMSAECVFFRVFGRICDQSIAHDNCQLSVAFGTRCAASSPSRSSCFPIHLWFLCGTLTQQSSYMEEMSTHRTLLRKHAVHIVGISVLSCTRKVTNEHTPCSPRSALSQRLPSRSCHPGTSSTCATSCSSSDPLPPDKSQCF